MSLHRPHQSRATASGGGPITPPTHNQAADLGQHPQLPRSDGTGQRNLAEQGDSGRNPPDTHMGTGSHPEVEGGISGQTREALGDPTRVSFQSVLKAAPTHLEPWPTARALTISTRHSRLSASYFLPLQPGS